MISITAGAPGEVKLTVRIDSVELTPTLIVNVVRAEDAGEAVSEAAYFVASEEVWQPPAVAPPVDVQLDAAAAPEEAKLDKQRKSRRDSKGQSAAMAPTRPDTNPT